MGEKTIENKLRVSVERADGLAIKFFVMSFTGFPDRIVLMPGGRIYFVELKSEGKTPSKRQRFVHKLLNRLGFPVYVIDDETGLNEFFKMIKAV